MKHLLLLLLFPFALSAQDVQWEHSFGGRQADYLFDLQPTADYGFIVAGSSLSQKSGNKQADAKGDLDFWIWKMDEHGAEDWQKSFGGSGSDFLMSIRNTRDGGFILGGTSDSGQSQSQLQKATGGSKQLEQPDGDKRDACRGGNDYWIIKLNAKGVEEWQVTLGGIGQDDLLAVLPTRDGGYIAGGSSASDANGDKTEKSRGNMDYWIVKLDKDGHLQWQRTFGGRYADLLRALEVTSDGGFLVAGYSNSPSDSNASPRSTSPETTSNNKTSLRGGSRSNPSRSNPSRSKPDKNQDPWGTGGDYWILKLDADGNIEWQSTLGGDKDDQLFSALQLKDGNYLVGGSSASGPSGNKSQTNRKGSDIWLLKLDTKGNILWQQTYDIGNADFLASIVENDDETLVVGAYAKAESASQKDGKSENDTGDFVAIKIDAKGDELWRKSVGSDGEDILKKAIETRDGGYVLAGTSDPEKSQSQSQSQSSRKGKASKGGVTVGNDGNLAGADRLQNEMDSTVNDAQTQANDFIKDQTDGLGLNKEKDLGGLKVGGQLAPSTALSSSPNTATATSSRSNPATATGIKPGAKQSRDKKANYGNRDFWVVKLKDKDKKIKDKKTIEAFPNPVVEYTNVIVGFDFTKGSLSVYDLGGHQLQTFPVTERTVPVNLAAYPEGIYIISVVTDKGEGSLKVMKGIN
ncbi:MULTISPECIES: T9SS type A sorting domain-containing protein [unclassified Flavobacterium]|uniref:T9SS type A sorting domain-containing protein n=1 Tax=unclassified Flavobacterium TaxID=196869 RepID=UPI001F13ED8D|nr:MULTISPECIES: T9SS type A sorting domain-containing protein [unclassified Flavobacterium]UMY66016.1 T9SS type A sorting domain-containing protein [Flavobacterium sp. HJ-32-4]